MRLSAPTNAAALALAVSMFGVSPPASAQTFHAEVHGGLDRLSGNVDKGGVLVGLGAGVDFDIVPAVSLGVQATADFSTVDGCAGQVLDAGDTLCARAQRDLGAVARLTYRFGSATRIYLLGGYTNARFRLDYNPETGPGTRLSTTSDGWRLGAGIQQGLGGPFYSKLEYRYSHYDAGTVRHQLLAGVGVRFP